MEAAFVQHLNAVVVIYRSSCNGIHQLGSVPRTPVSFSGLPLCRVMFVAVSEATVSSCEQICHAEDLGKTLTELKSPAVAPVQKFCREEEFAGSKTAPASLVPWP